MRVKNWKVALVAAGVLVAATATVRQAHAEDGSTTRVVHRVKDTASGGEVRVYADEKGVSRLEVADDQVQVVTTFARPGAETVVMAGHERVRLAMSPTGLVVTLADGRRLPPATDRASAERIRDRLLASPGMTRAFRLLDRLTIPATAPVAPLVWGVKVVVHAAMGDERVFRQAPRLAARKGTGATLTRVSVDGQDRGPTWCWDEYSREAIKAQIELEQCLAQLRWWEFYLSLKDDHCYDIFGLRAMGAFAWWLNCVALSI